MTEVSFGILKMRDDMGIDESNISGQVCHINPMSKEIPMDMVLVAC